MATLVLDCNNRPIETNNMEQDEMSEFSASEQTVNEAAQACAQRLAITTTNGAFNMENIGRLCVTRRAGETLVIGGTVVVTFRRIYDDSVSVLVKDTRSNEYCSRTINPSTPLQLAMARIELLKGGSRGQAKICIIADRAINIVRGELLKNEIPST